MALLLRSVLFDICLYGVMLVLGIVYAPAAIWSADGAQRVDPGVRPEPDGRSGPDVGEVGQAGRVVEGVDLDDEPQPPGRVTVEARSVQAQ